jgi:hypothetical protein
MFYDPIKDRPKMYDEIPYDKRSSVFVNQGTFHGSGHRQPVGRSGDPKSSAKVLPTNGAFYEELRDKP